MSSLLQTITTNQTIINSNTAAISDLQTDKQNVLIAGNETRSGRTGFSGEFSSEFSVGRAARRDVASQPAT